MSLFLGYDSDSDSDDYLAKTGGTMTGDIDLDGNDITGISSVPSTDSSVVSKKYVKDNYVNSSGGTGMVGNLDMNRNIIFNLANDSSLGSAVKREYVHSTFLQKSGGTMSGNINLDRNDITGLPNAPSTSSSAVSKTYLTQNYGTDSDIKKHVRDIYFPKFGGRLQGLLDMNGRNIVGIPDIPYSNSSSVVNKKYVDDKASKVIIYRYLHFTSVGRNTAWGQESTTGFPFLPLGIINPNSKSVLTILSISSDKDTRTSKPSGLLDSTIKILLKYYTDDGTTKGSGEVTVGTFKMTDFRHHEITDGTVTSVVYPVNIKYVLSHSISDYADLEYVTFGITQTIGYEEDNEVKMSLRYEDFE